MDSQFTAAWACWHVDLKNAAVQWGWTMETRPKPSFQISLTWQVSTRLRGVEIQSLVQYWIKTVCCRSKDHFHWTAPPPVTRWSQKWGILSPTTPGCAAHVNYPLWIQKLLYYTIQHEGGRQIDCRQMFISPIQTTANNCKTAFSLHVVESASDDCSF